jgi:flagellar basal body-associated protein FliL
MSDTMREALFITMIGAGVVLVIAAISIALFVWWKRASDREHTRPPR